MTKIKKYFGEFNMTWPKVIIFAVITAVYTALINQVPFLKETSFQDIAISFECWILFAVFIIVNCDKWWEASLKCFVFFLISQPLIYLIEVPFFSRGWEIFQYYRRWFIFTILTLPGAVIAFQLKKKNWLSVLVLCVANGFLVYLCVYYLQSTLKHFPYHLLSSIFCLALAVFFVFVLLDEKKHRTAALAVIAAVLAACIIFSFTVQGGASSVIILEEGNWVCTTNDDSVVSVEITDGNRVTLTSIHNGAVILDFEDSDGNVCSYNIVANGRDLMISPVD